MLIHSATVKKNKSNWATSGTNSRVEKWIFHHCSHRVCLECMCLSVASLKLVQSRVQIWSSTYDAVAIKGTQWEHKHQIHQKAQIHLQSHMAHDICCCCSTNANVAAKIEKQFCHVIFSLRLWVCVFVSFFCLFGLCAWFSCGPPF